MNQTHFRMSKNGWLRGASLGCLAILSTAGAAMAQDAAVPAEEGELEAVVITGSRTLRDGSTAPTPVTVLAPEQLQNASPRNLTEGLQQLPAFRNTTSANTPASTASSNTAGSFLNLRDLGQARTLVLLDGRRVAPGATNGAINIDLLPQPLIKRVDVVTGGASSTYGSDAVAGVVNFILDTDYTGVKGTIQGGISDVGDLGSYRFEISAGTRWLDDRLHIIANYGKRRSDPVYSLVQREWANPMAGRIAIAGGINQGFPTTLLPDVRQVTYIGGVILANNTNPSTLQNIKFLPNGVASPYNPGLFNNGTNQQGGDGWANYVSLGSKLVTETTFTRANFDVTDNLRIFAQAATAKVNNVYEVSTPSTVQTSPFTIFEDNFYLPPEIKTALLAAPAVSTCAASANPATMPAAYQSPASIRCFRVNRFNLDFGRLTGDITSYSQDYVAGFESKIFGEWRLDGYYEHGRNLTKTINYNNLEFEHVYAAADVIANPAVGGVPGVAAGAPVCRARLVSPVGYANCQPLNIFGFGRSSQAAYDYVASDGLFQFESIQDVVAANIAGEPFQLPAGPLSFAFGAEYRKLSVEQESDAPSQIPTKFQGATGGVRGVPTQLIGVAGARAFSNLLPFKGEYSVKEAYVELDIPLLKDLPLIQELSLNTAGRYTDYSTSGEVETWKVGMSYRPVESLRLRATVSRDIRAPNSVELFQTGSRFQRTFNDPFRGQTSTTAFDVAIGDPSLTPEFANSFVAGVVFTPTALPGFTASVDYYDIEITGALENLSAQDTLNQCFNSGGTAPVCNNIKHSGGAGPYNQTVANSGATITLVELPYVNLSSARTRGADVEISYRRDLGFVPGRLTSRLLFGYIDEFSTTVPGAPTIDRAGTVIAGNSPRLKGVLQLTYDNGPLQLNVQQRYIGHGYHDNTLIEGVTINDNQVPSYMYTDLTTRYKFGTDQNYEVFLTINNLWDKDPPIEPNGSATSWLLTNIRLYDQIGRYYTTGLRFRF